MILLQKENVVLLILLSELKSPLSSDDSVVKNLPILETPINAGFRIG